MYFKEEELLRQKCFESLIYEYINKQHEDVKNKLIQKNNNSNLSSFIWKRKKYNGQQYCRIKKYNCKYKRP